MNKKTFLFGLMLVFLATAVNAIACGDTITADTTLTADLTGCTGDGLIVGETEVEVTLNCAGYNIQGDGLSVSGENGIEFAASNVNIVDCNIGMFYNGIELAGPTGAMTILHNTISNNSNYGIYNSTSNDNNIGDNNILNNINGGIYAISVNDLNISGKNLVSENGEGIQIEASISSLVFDNNISQNEGYGLNINNSDDTNISNNLISDNDDYGVIFKVGGADANFYNNVILNNDVGEYGVVASATGAKNTKYFFNNYVDGHTQDYYVNDSDTNFIVISDQTVGLNTDVALGLTSYIGVGWWLDLNIADAVTRAPIDNANVKVADTYGTQWYDLNTDAIGTVGYRNYWVLDFNEMDDDSHLMYSPYEFTAYAAGYDSNTFLQSIDQNKIVTIYLQESSVNTAPDTNIVSIDNSNDILPLMFSDSKDGNLTTKFFVVDTDSDDLNFNMWWGTSQSAKTNEVVRDVNLSSAVCDSDINGLMGTYCEWDLDIQYIPSDNNIFITIEVNDGTAADTNSTEFATGILIDNNAPIVDHNAGEFWETEWFNYEFTLSFSCTDTTSGCKTFAYGIVGDANYYMTIDGNVELEMMVDGNTEIFYYASDILDNNSASAYLNIGLDQTAPTIDHNATGWETEWFNYDLNVNFACSDADAGCKTIAYGVVGDANYFLPAEDGNAWKEFSTDGNHEVFYYASDAADNNSASAYLNIGIDKTAPTIDHNATGWETEWFNYDLNINFSCSDATSGCKTLAYGIVDDANYYIALDLDSNVGVNITVDGNTEIFYYASDEADNNSASAYLNIGLDQTAPTIDHNATGWETEWFNYDLNVNFACSDATTDCETFAYGIVGDANYFVSWDIDSNIGVPVTTDGNTEIFYYASDSLDNNSIVAYLNIGIDQTKPTISLTTPNDGNQGVIVKLVEFDVNDSTAGIDLSSITVDLNGVTSAYFSVGACINFSSNFHCSYTEEDWVQNVSYYIDVNVSDVAANKADSNTTNFKYIGVNIAPDANIDFVKGYDANAIPPLSYYRDVNATIDFNVLDAENDELLIDIAYGAKLSFDNLIASDVNAGDICDDYDFTDSTHCSWDLNLSIPADGNHYVNIQIDDGTDFITRSSDANFMIDNTKPSVYWDGNVSWQDTDANVHLTCADGSGSGCFLIQFRKDTDFGSSVSFGSWQSYDLNIFYGNDGNHALDWNATDGAGNVGDINTFYVLVDKTTPSLTASSPASDTTTPNDTFTFVFDIADDFNGSTVSCDYNVQLDGSPIAGYTNLNVVSSGEQCTISHSLTVVGGQTIDVNAMPRDSVNTGSIVQSKSITYQPASPPPSNGGNGGGGRERSGIGGFCVADSDCEFGLVCLEFTCVVEGADINGIIVFPEEITSSPFEDVLPDYNVSFPDVVVANYSDSLFVLKAYFDCSDEELCAADWCHISSEEFELQPRGQRILRASCVIPSDAVIGETYTTSLIIQDKASGLKKGVLVIIPIKKASYGFLFTGLSVLGDSVSGLFSFGLLCFGRTENCLFSFGERPLDFGLIKLYYINASMLLAILSAIVLFVSFAYFKQFVKPSAIAFVILLAITIGGFFL